MRQGQQHRRGRSRGGHNGGNSNNNQNANNRKGQNPISRTYQSNGPDGKVSGTASGIAEKYLSMARDAHSSGDPVLAENYLQHAEHYNRIILAYRESQAQAGDDGSPGGQQRNRMSGQNDANDGGDDAGDDEIENYGRDMQPLPPVDPPQPRVIERGGDGPPRGFEGGRTEGGRTDAPRYEDRQPRFNDQQRRPQRERYQSDRGPDRGGERGADRGQERQNNGDRFNGQPRGDRGERMGQDRFQGERPERNDRQPYGDRQPREGFGDRQSQGDRGFRGQPPHRPDGQRSDMPRSEMARLDLARPDAPRADMTRSDGMRDGMRDNMRMDQPRGDLSRSEPHRHDAPPPVDPVRDAIRPEPAFIEPLLRAELPYVSDQPDVPPIAEPAVRPAPRRRERAAAVPVSEHEQPEFLRRPVRRPRREAPADGAAPVLPPPPDREPGKE